MIILAYILAPFIGGWFARMDGGAPPRVNEWIERTLCMSFFLYATWMITQDWWAAAAYAGVLGLATGHGQYFLSRQIRPISPEKVDFIVRLFWPDDPRSNKNFEHLFDKPLKQIPESVTIVLRRDSERYGMKKLYWRNVTGMFCTGFLVGLPAGIIAIVYGAYLSALFFLCTGFAKSISYILGYSLYQAGLLEKLGKHLDHATAAGEYANGFIRTLFCILAILAL